MKESELDKLSRCVVCGNPMLDQAGGNELTMYRVQVARLAWDLAAIDRRVGLQAMMGGHGAVARAMGPDEHLTLHVAGPSDAMVHESCAAKVNHILELMPNDEDETPEPQP